MCYDSRYSERTTRAERERWWGSRQKEAPKEETTADKPETVETEVPAEFVMEEFEPTSAH
ncbi:hypothetical protein [Georgenia sp. SYP-B2076]|uniref:hypothetical protein n=1 Tax=Georgenia sp. SYP-B2076 TaxID=2495881 RepID=UPI000F8CC47E|nr:hypothetical protein [Georgenia sp. SYP-B2076]